jgi:TRAP-type C4-dicarboxylate transport system permease small subunit
MKATYVRAMDALHRLCMIIAGTCLVTITLIIPWGVFTRYVLNYGSSWPEPTAVLLMIWFSFTAAALCYREGLHIGVKLIPASWGMGRVVIAWFIELCMAFINVFMLAWGISLVQTTWHSALADFPLITAGFPICRCRSAAPSPRSSSSSACGSATCWPNRTPTP